jgi:hypothetical protein
MAILIALACVIIILWGAFAALRAFGRFSSATLKDTMRLTNEALTSLASYDPKAPTPLNQPVKGWLAWAFGVFILVVIVVLIWGSRAISFGP